MEKELKIMESDEYLPLRDVVFKTLRQAILKGDMEPRASDGDYAGK